MTDGPIAAGTVFQEEGKFRGRKVNAKREIIGYDPPASLGFEVRDGTIPGRGSYTFRSTAEGKEVTFSAEGDLGRVAEFFAPLLVPVIERQFRRDGQQLIELLESSTDQRLA